MRPLGGIALPASALDATPRLGVAPELARAYNLKLLRSFIMILDRFPDLCVESKNRILRLLNDIDPGSKQNPSLYRIYFKCRDAVDNVTLRNLITELLIHYCNNSATDLSIERMSRRDWLLRDVIRPIEAEGSNLAFYELTTKNFITEEARVQSAWDLISAMDPEMGEELRTFVARIYLFQGRTVVGLTSPRFHGAMFLSASLDPGDPTYYVEHLVHESSHMRLNTLIAFDPLVRNGDVAAFEAPIRPDKRPMLGVLHATFVLFRIVRVLSRCADHAKVGDYHRWVAATAAARARLEKGLDVLNKHADFTDWGRRLVASMHA